MIALPGTSNREPPRPEWIDDKLITETKAVWGPKFGRELTVAEALEILLNFGRLVDAIQGHKT